MFRVYCDVDGVLTPPKKLFQVRFGTFDGTEDVRWYKEFSDRDSWVMQRLRGQLFMISQDRRNEHYAEYKGHEFLHVDSEAPSKYEVLRDHTDNSPWVYLGDAPFDYECLVKSDMGFVPADADEILKLKLQKEGRLRISPSARNVMLLGAMGGEGCLAEAMYALCSPDVNTPEWVKDMQVFKEIREFLK